MEGGATWEVAFEEGCGRVWCWKEEILRLEADCDWEGHGVGEATSQWDGEFLEWVWGQVGMFSGVVDVVEERLCSWGFLCSPICVGG